MSNPIHLGIVRVLHLRYFQFVCGGMTLLNTISWVMTFSRVTNHITDWPESTNAEINRMVTIGTRWLCRQSALHNGVCLHRWPKTHRDRFCQSSSQLLAVVPHVYLLRYYNQTKAMFSSPYQVANGDVDDVTPRSILCCRTAVCYTS